MLYCCRAVAFCKLCQAQGMILMCLRCHWELEAGGKGFVFQQPKCSKLLASERLQTPLRKQVGIGWAQLEQKLQPLQSQGCCAPPALPLSTAAWESWRRAKNPCRMMGLRMRLSKVLLNTMDRDGNNYIKMFI